MQTLPNQNGTSNWWKWLVGCLFVSILCCTLTVGGWWVNSALKPCQSLDLSFKRSGCEEIIPMSESSLLRLSKDGNVLAAYVDLDTLQILDIKTGGFRELSYNGSEVIGTYEFDIALTSDGSYVAVIGSTTGQPQLGLVDTTSEEIFEQIIPLPEAHYATRVAFSPDDKILAVAINAEQDYVGLFRIPGGEQVGHLNLSGDNFAVAFSPDGRLATAFGGQIEIWDLDKKNIETRFGSELPAVYSMEFSPDGKLLAVSSGKRYDYGGMRLDVFRVADGQSIYHFQGSGFDNEFPATFSADSNLFAVSSCSEANVYRVSDGGLVATFKRPWDSQPFQYADCLSAIQFNPDGKSVYYGWDRGGAVVKWRLP